jgi:hypothetical protein
MPTCPDLQAFKSSYERVQTVARFVSSLPPDLRPLGLMFEEPTGEAFPFEIGGCHTPTRLGTTGATSGGKSLCV